MSDQGFPISAWSIRNPIPVTVLFIGLCVLILREGFKDGAVRRDMAIAMLIIFVFNVMIWCFFEQAGSSFNFLAQNIVDRDLGGWVFPLGWFQSVNSLAIIALAPVLAWLWVKMGSANPSIPRKFGLGLIFNGLAFLLLVFALSSLVDPETLKAVGTSSLATADLGYPVAVGPKGETFFFDNFRILAADPDGRVSTFAGAGLQGLKDNPDPLLAEFAISGSSVHPRPDGGMDVLDYDQAKASYVLRHIAPAQ
jgi:hypothetical protein